MARKAKALRRRPGPARDPAGASRLREAAARHAVAGRLAEAAALYQRADLADPTDFRAAFSLATIELQQGRPREAVPLLRRVTMLAPDLFEAWRNLAGASQALGLWDEAARAYGRALELRPDAVETRQLYAIALAALGRIEAAAAEHRRLAATPSTRLWALTRLALLRPGNIGDADLAEMRAAASDAATDQETRTGLWFALGEALEQRGDADAAFDAFAEGNWLKREALAANPGDDPAAILAQHQTSARRVRETCTADFLAARAGLGLSTTAPIFIVGMPRSGSTLIEQILSSHPEVSSLGETAILPRLLEAGGLGAAPGQRELRALGRRYLDDARACGWRGVGRFVDKTLENYLHVGAIALIFPRAVILHAVRDPVDTCLSCWRQLFAPEGAGGGAETLYDLADIGAEYVAYREVMDHWRRVLPGRVIDVDHEALVADPERQIRWLVTQGAGLAWSDACLAFHEAGRAAPTASAAQVRQPIFTSSIERWRRYEARLGPLLDALGPYAPSAPDRG